jgi:hypothetical protein
MTLAEQVSEVEREIALRKNVYPGFVARKNMKQADADLHLERMIAVLRTLRWLQTNEDEVRAAIIAADRPSRKNPT